MKKKYENKMVNETSEKQPKSLKVLRECNVPGLGAWKRGEIITNKVIIKRMKDNPNFEVIKEAK